MSQPGDQKTKTERKRRVFRWIWINTDVAYNRIFLLALSNLVLSATSRSEADILPMSSKDEDCERRLLELLTANLLRLEVEPVSFPELP